METTPTFLLRRRLKKHFESASNVCCTDTVILLLNLVTINTFQMKSSSSETMSLPSVN